MPNTPPISTPAGYAPAFALGFSDAQSQLKMVSDAEPLPVTLAAASGSGPSPAPLEGQTSASLLVGPFDPARDVPIVVSLSGEWTGSARLLRSVDGGLTLQTLRVGGIIWGTFHEQGCEQVWTESESGVSFYLDIVMNSGTLDYRVSQ